MDLQTHPEAARHTTTTVDSERRSALAEQVFLGAVGALETLHIYVGDRLGLYASLAEVPDASPDELANATGIAERYAREWLEQQAVAGLVAVVTDNGDPTERRYRLPQETAEIMTDADSLDYLAPLALLVTSVGQRLPDVLEAIRTGGGVPYAAYGPAMRHGIAAVNRPMFIHLLATDWLPALPDIDRHLRSTAPARILDVGCGMGASTIALAGVYPRARVLGIDLDQDSVSEARHQAVAAGLADRISFAVDDAARPTVEGRFDLVTIFEALHDMSEPVQSLRALRALLCPGGAVLIADERVADTFAPPGDLIERFMYGWSILHCLPVGLAGSSGKANGTVLRASTVATWAEAAGFTQFEVLPIENLLWRFYRLSG